MKKVPSQLKALPSVDVVIPAYNEADHIEHCLERTLGQHYPAGFRILLVDAGSSDATAEIAERVAARDPRVEVVGAGRRLTTPEALNFGISHARAEIVARIDAHGWPEPDFLAQAATTLCAGNGAIACVGGRPLEAGDSRFGRAFTLARGSRFGVGGSVYAAAERQADVDTVPWGMYRRSVLVESGGFDPEMNHGEDEELNWRLRELGYRVVFDPAVRFRYVPRKSLADAFRQYRGYGEARVRVVSKHPEFLRARHMAPAVLVAGTAGLAAGAPFRRGARAALSTLAGFYAGASVWAALAATRGEDRSLTALVAVCFPALHAGYGVGTLSGVAKRLVRAVGSGRRQSVSSAL